MEYRKRFMPGESLIVKHSKYVGSRTGMVLIARAHEAPPYAQFLVAVRVDSPNEVRTDWFHPNVLEPMPHKSLDTPQDVKKAAGGLLPVWLGSEVYSMADRAAEGMQARLWTVCELRLPDWKRFVGGVYNYEEYSGVQEPRDDYAAVGRRVSREVLRGARMVQAVLVVPGTDQHATARYADLAVSPAAYAARKHRRERPRLKHPESANPTIARV